jgi:hypothetical protein
MTEQTDETLVFHFEAGGTHMACDPFRVERLLAQSLKGEPLADVLRAARAPVPSLSGPAVEKLLAAARDAFGLPPVGWDGAGVTEKAAMRVLREFLRWRAEVKGRPFAGPSPTSAAATGPESSGDSSPTRSATPSGS